MLTFILSGPFRNVYIPVSLYTVSVQLGGLSCYCQSLDVFPHCILYSSSQLVCYTTVFLIMYVNNFHIYYFCTYLFPL